MTQHKQAARARLAGVRLTYDEGKTWSLDGVDLTVHVGEHLCVLGPNGSGKSTLTQLLCGLEAPDEGTVELAGSVVFGEQGPDGERYRLARRRTGLVFQNPEDQIVTSIVAHDVAFGPENLGVESAQISRRVDEELARVGLSSRAQDDPARLSGGQQQRVALAGALAMHPDLLVLDEPGAMLDVRGRRGIMRVLGQLKHEGCAIVHVTHFMDEALAADRVIIMEAGRIALEGTPREVFAHAGRLRELGLDVPLAARAALDLGLGTAADARELAARLATRGGQAKAAQGGQNMGEDQASEQKGPLAQAPEDPQGNRCETGQAEPSLAPKASRAAAPEAPAPHRNATQTPPALRMQDVSFAYEGAPTLRGVSFAVGAGELVALCGQTGSGKSTLARLACALATPSAGTVEVCGIPTTSRRKRRQLRGAVGYVMQQPERQLFAQTVWDDIAYGPRNLGLSEDEVSERVAAQLERMGLAHKAQASPFALSGGQQRLVALAGVLAMEPGLLVLDEPVAGLDPRGAARLRALVRELHEQGTAILMISHSMDDVAELADRMVVLGAGNVALEGTPAQVFSHKGRLRELGLGVPEALALADALGKQGVSVPGRPLTLGQLTQALREARPC